MTDSNKSTVNSGIFNPLFPVDEPFPFGSTSSDSGKNISLKSVSVKGDITGLLFSSTIRQEYRNETEHVLEISYTFPLGWGTALLGMEAQIGDKHLKGQVVEKVEAEEKYDKAIKDGNSAIIVRESSRGLYTAKLGNIKPNEAVTVDIHCAKLLAYEQGRVRLCIPTVIGERYGDEHCPGGLAPDETAKVDVNARYGFSLSIELHGDIANGEISCPSHNLEIKKINDGLHISLDREASLDRDFVLLMKNVGGNSHALYVQDEDCWLAAASFIPEMPVSEQTPLALKILVDCSGSMSGDSIGQAQKGLQKILSLLGQRDYVSYSKFGSKTKHLSKTMLPCSGENLGNLSAVIKATDADMGGTEMHAALESTFLIRQSAGQEIPPAILLITDGDVWDIKNIVASAKKSGHRIFAICVGYAPSETMLRDLAEQTGGACEFVTPDENMAEAIVRMFNRMRGSVASGICVKWGNKPVWQSHMPKFIYDGETVHAFALLSDKPEVGPVLSWEFNGQKGQAKADRIEETDNRDLLRLGHKCQLEETRYKRCKIALALKYELVSEFTSLILVYEREDADKIEGRPVVQQVPQMPAHGHGSYLQAGMACCAPAAIVGSSMLFLSPPPISRSRRTNLIELDSSDEDIEDMSMNPLLARAVLAEWKQKLGQLASIDDFIGKIEEISFLESVVEFLDDLASKNGISRQAVWSIFICWQFEQRGSNIDQQSLSLLKNDNIGEEDKNKLLDAFNAWADEAL